MRNIGCADLSFIPRFLFFPLTLQSNSHSSLSIIVLLFCIFIPRNAFLFLFAR